jgi:hypothetical protein
MSEESSYTGHCSFGLIRNDVGGQSPTDVLLCEREGFPWVTLTTS